MTPENFIKTHPDLLLSWSEKRLGRGKLCRLGTPRFDVTKAVDSKTLPRDQFKMMVLEMIDGLQEYYRRLIIAYCDL